MTTPNNDDCYDWDADLEDAAFALTHLITEINPLINQGEAYAYLYDYLCADPVTIEVAQEFGRAIANTVGRPTSNEGWH